MVVFLPGGSYDVMFWIFDENSNNMDVIAVAQSQGSFSFSHCLASEGFGVQKELRGDRTRTADLNCPKGLPMLHGIVLNNKAGIKKGAGGTFGVMVFVFPTNLYMCQALLSWQWLMGSSQ